jgi:phage-related protein (TIGR01555 family)
VAAAPDPSAAPKPRIRVRTDGRVRSTDSYENFAARLGIGAENYSSQSTYGFNPITRIRTLLEWMYRGSWLVGKAVDCIPQDMCKRGIKFIGIQDLKRVEQLKHGMRRHGLWQHVMMTLTWARLYGGAICVAMIRGQDVSTPLRIETVGKGQLQGFLVLDRWMIEPSLEDLVTDMDDADLGKPRFYTITADAPALPRLRVHHSRCMRFVGVELPYWQMIAENMWGMSVLERLYDRLVAFDSATQGASQLMYRADIRTYSVEGLRKIIAAGGPAYDALVSQIKHNSLWQANERMFIIDSADKFERQQYAFSGISDTILQFGQQISGAIDIPLTRLFGQSPAGLNATGESDMVTYYDGIQQRQETDLRPRLGWPIRVIARSEGLDDEGVTDFVFNPLWQLTEEQKANIAERITATAIAAVESAMISERTALKELRSQAGLTGVWTQITDEDIENADDRTPPSQAEIAQKMEEQMEAEADLENLKEEGLGEAGGEGGERVGTGAEPKSPPGEAPKPPPGSPPMTHAQPIHLSISRGMGMGTGNDRLRTVK